MNKELREYEQKLLKEMEHVKLFSWKRLRMAIELSSICDMLRR